MAVRIVRLGSRRQRGEGLRMGTVRYTPRGVPKSKYAKLDWFDVWLPNLTDRFTDARDTIPDDGTGWSARRYQAELKRPEQSHLLDVLAALSTNEFLSWLLLRRRGTVPQVDTSTCVAGAWCGREVGGERK